MTFTHPKVCPKCHYIRSIQDDKQTPATKCPRCGIVYAKFSQKPSLKKPITGQNRSRKTIWYDSIVIVTILLIVFFPVGFFGLYKNTKLSAFTKCTITILFILMFSYSIFSGLQPKLIFERIMQTAFNENYSSLANSTCEDFVKTNLGSSHTKFPEMFPSITKDENQIYEIKSYVNTPNAVDGGLKRNYWNCKIQFQGKNSLGEIKWKLIYLDISK